MRLSPFEQMVVNDDHTGISAMVASDPSVVNQADEDGRTDNN
jgi:hypothetical protein